LTYYWNLLSCAISLRCCSEPAHQCHQLDPRQGATSARLVHREAPTFPKEEKARVRADVEELYERTLSAETALSVMFLFGHFLLQVYLSDTLLDRIFPTDPAKRDIYLAAWEGHLTRRPFGNLLTPRRGRITWISMTASRCILLLPSSTLQKSCSIPTPWKRFGVSDRRPATWSLEALGAATKDRGREDRRRQLGDAMTARNCDGFAWVAGHGLGNPLRR
jgi:hypothetical protein